MQNKLKKWKYDEWLGLLFLAASVIMLGISVRLCFADGIWYDELYTMGLTNRSFADLTALTARDVHPPFYYYYVKVIQSICKVFCSGVNVVVVSKIASVLPLVGLLIYAVTKVRKHFGALCAGLFIFCLIAMPNLPQYTVEIRMYTLAMFLVTAAFLHAYEIVCGHGKRNWICLTVYGILAAYTHYFACVAVAMVYVFLLIYMIYENYIACKKQKSTEYSIKSWLIAVAASVIAYVPWMFVVVKQVAQVKESYWILPLTWRIFGSCVKFLMKPPFGSGTFQVIAAVLLFVIYVGLWLYVLWKNKDNRRESFLLIAGTGVLAGVVLFGFVASFLIRPIFITRYMLPSVGCFWLAFAVAVSRTKTQKWIFLPVIAAVLVIGIGDYRWFRNDETWRRVRMEEVTQALSQIEPEDVVVTHFNHVQGVTGYYLENEIMLWEAEPEELLCDVIEGKYGTIASIEQLKTYLKEGKTVWFIGDRQAELLAQWEEAGIHAEEKQEFMLEVYWATLYHLSMD